LFFRLILILTLLLPIYLRAQFTPPLSTDRPDQTKAPYVVPQHLFQIETGIVMQKDKPIEDVSVTTNKFATSLLRYGLVEGIELRLSGAYIQEQTQYLKGMDNRSGIEGFNIGAKFHLSDEEGIMPQTGLITSIIIPLGDKYFTDDEFVPEIIFAAQHNITKWASISYNLGANLRKNQNSLYRYSLALGFQALKKIAIFTEIFGIVKKTSTPAHVIDFGMTYLVVRNIQLDTSYGFAITDIAADSFFNFGLSWRIPK
jgi:hypothetical protein